MLIELSKVLQACPPPYVQVYLWDVVASIFTQPTVAKYTSNLIKCSRNQLYPLLPKLFVTWTVLVKTDPLIHPENCKTHICTPPHTKHPQMLFSRLNLFIHSQPLKGHPFSLNLDERLNSCLFKLQKTLIQPYFNHSPISHWAIFSWLEAWNISNWQTAKG